MDEDLGGDGKVENIICLFIIQQEIECESIIFGDLLLTGCEHRIYYVHFLRNRQRSCELS